MTNESAELFKELVITQCKSVIDRIKIEHFNSFEHYENTLKEELLHAFPEESMLRIQISPDYEREGLYHFRFYNMDDDKY